jgi:hypothetical protein
VSGLVLGGGEASMARPAVAYTCRDMVGAARHVLGDNRLLRHEARILAAAIAVPERDRCRWQDCHYQHRAKETAEIADRIDNPRWFP